MAHAERSAKRHGARRAFIVDVARNMIQPNVEALIGLGARWIQIDEPGGSTDPHELDLFAESFNEPLMFLRGEIGAPTGQVGLPQPARGTLNGGLISRSRCTVLHCLGVRRIGFGG